MAISGQGAPGVRTELADVSGVEIVNNPAIIGGVVGFSSKGPLNEIIELSSTEDMDTILGSGFNNPKYNQGLYATRGILNVGGNVEFVRPYGEEVITDVDDPAYDYSQKLKTDAFMVSYNFDMGINDTESIVIDHHAATRWKRDGLASDFPGSSREIYTIQETIVESTNTNFVIDSAGVGNNNNTIALFAIMNNDPTAALRATAADVGTSLVTMQLFASMITIGSTTVIAMGDTSSFTANDKIKFTAGVDGILPTGITEGVEYIVSTVTTDTSITVDVTTSDTGTDAPTGHIITNMSATQNAITVNVTDSGKDYLTVKTAASNTASKVTETLNIVGIPTVNNTFGARMIDGSFKTLEFVSEGGVVTVGDVPIAVEIATFDGTTGVNTSTNEITVDDSSNFNLGDVVMVSTSGTLPTGLSASTEYVIDTISGSVITLDGVTISVVGSGTITMTNLSAIMRNIKAALLYQNENIGIYKFGIELAIPSASDGTIMNITACRGVKVPSSITTMFDLSGLGSAYITTTSYAVVETTISILTQDAIGRKFVALGLAVESYIDIDFDGIANRVFTLNSTGVLISAIYLEVDYYFAGELYNFSGTIVPYVYGDTNLYILPSAESVENGWKFIINENEDLGYAAEDTLFDLSTTVIDSLTSAEFSSHSYNAFDDAVINDSIWLYDARANNSTATISSAWDLFLDKDKADSDMLIAAGTDILNLFSRGLEELNHTVIDKMLLICEKRKDMFAIFDGVDEPRIDVALRKMIGIGSQGNSIGRWGAIFDGRSLFVDSIYTRLTVEVVKSIEVSQIITANRSNNVWWLPPAGAQTGNIPSFMATRQKFTRSFNYAEDPNSDIAKLYNSSINPTRTNKSGACIYGQKSMLKRDTALNRLNVIMLVAGIHKRFGKYLDYKVFQVNTAPLRNNIQTELQTQLESIKSANPAGLVDGLVQCDEKNNPSYILDTNQLIVDVKLQPTKASEFITLRTTVQRTGADLNNTNTTLIIGG